MTVEEQIRLVRRTQEDLYKAAQKAENAIQVTTLTERADALHFVVISLQRFMRLQSAITELITT